MEVLLQIDSIAKSFGDLVLFDDISLSVHKSEKVAIIAKNGAGKSTLLNIISKKDSPDSGNIIYKKNLNIKYLSQNPDIDENKKIIDVIYDNHTEKGKLIKEYELYLLNNDLDKMQSLISKIDSLSAWDYQREITELLDKLKINNLKQVVSTLSGGQKKRLALALTLIDNPDFIILDEPTNHLDLEIIEWLEEYLKNSKSTLLMVTHDRYFLDRVCNIIIELEDNKIYKYKGNYNYYLEKRQERKEQKTAEVEKAKNLLRKELDWMHRMPKARGGKAKYRIDKFYELKEKSAVNLNEDEIKAKVSARRLGKKILEIKNISKSFDNNLIINDFSYSFQKNEKVCIVGKNGTGKSTFLNLITGNLKPDTGIVEKGETVVFGYYKQGGITVNENEKVIDVISNIADFIEIEKGKKISASAFLNYFLFPPKRQQDFVYKLSGGEKRRLYLLSVLVKNPNFLILDEPTNDLDIMTLNVLEDFLANYPGVVVIVSHDRYFTDKIADKLFVFEGKGEIKEFPGNYTQYSEYKKINEQKAKKTETDVKSVKEAKKKNDYSNRLTYNEKRELEELDSVIQELEEKKKKLEDFINSGTTNHEELLKKSEELSQVMQELEEKEFRWLELSEKDS